MTIAPRYPSLYQLNTPSLVATVCRRECGKRITLAEFTKPRSTASRGEASTGFGF